jgi:DNA-binding transcriptional LysR family regulator
MSKQESIAGAEDSFARKVDWNLFKCFYEIARSGGVGAAARLLTKQQPSISAALKRLEQQVNAQLCVRTSRGIELTPAGRKVLSLCAAMYAAAQGASPAALASDHEHAGEVTLRVISHLELPQFNAALSEFHRSFPRIEIKLDVAPWRLVLKSLKNGDVELGIGFDSSPSGELTYVALRDEVQQLYCGPQHPLFGRTAGPELLNDETFVLAGREEAHEIARYRSQHDLGNRVGGVADNLSERMLLIRLGVGIGFLPEAVVAASATANEFWPLLPHAAAPAATIYLMSRAQHALSGPAQLLVDRILAQLDDPPAATRQTTSRDRRPSLPIGQ